MLISLVRDGVRVNPSAPRVQHIRIVHAQYLYYISCIQFFTLTSTKLTDHEMMKNERVPKYTIELPGTTNQPRHLRRPAVVHMIANIVEKRTVYFLATISVGGLIVVAFTKYYREIISQKLNI